MNTEQEKFDAWLVSLSRPTDKYVMSLWWGSAATMPTYRDSWTEAQWKGWQARAKLEKPNPWKAVIDKALVVSCLNCIGDEETPEQALARLIEWEIEIALDPAVSSGVKALAYPPAQVGECRSDGRCQYAIDHGAEGMGHCPPGKCVQPEQQAPAAWCDEAVLRGRIGLIGSSAQKQYWERSGKYDRELAQRLIHPLYAHPAQPHKEEAK